MIAAAAKELVLLASTRSSSRKRAPGWMSWTNFSVVVVQWGNSILLNCWRDFAVSLGKGSSFQIVLGGSAGTRCKVLFINLNTSRNIQASWKERQRNSNRKDTQKINKMRHYNSKILRDINVVVILLSLANKRNCLNDIQYCLIRHIARAILSLDSSRSYFGSTHGNFFLSCKRSQLNEAIIVCFFLSLRSFPCFSRCSSSFIKKQKQSNQSVPHRFRTSCQAVRNQKEKPRCQQYRRFQWCPCHSTAGCVLSSSRGRILSQRMNARIWRASSLSWMLLWRSPWACHSMMSRGANKWGRAFSDWAHAKPPRKAQ